jgi:hypothetical protein
MKRDTHNEMQQPSVVMITVIMLDVVMLNVTNNSFKLGVLVLI